MAERISKEAALSFLLTYMVVERQFPLRLDPLALFEVMNMAAEGAQIINRTEGIIPHELLEEMASRYISAHRPQERRPPLPQQTGKAPLELHGKVAFIFDLDGTLLDTEPLYTQAAQTVISPYGKQFDPSLKKRIMGGDSRVSAAIIIEHHDLPISVDEFLTLRQWVLLQLFPDAPEIRGAGAIVRLLASQGAKLGLATSSHRDLCDLKLRNRGWEQCFGAIVCGDDPRLKHAKPDPDIFLLCARDLRVDPSECVVFEDSPIGIRAALAAGMTAVAINSSDLDRSDLAEAAMIVRDFEEVRSHLER